MLDGSHPFVPRLQLSVLNRQLKVARVEKIPKHSKQIKIDEARLLFEKKGTVGEHLFEWDKVMRQIVHELALLSPPLFQAAAAEFALFMADERKAFRGRQELFEINIVQPETHRFNFVLDVTPEDILEAFPWAGKQTQLQFFVQIFGNDL